MEQATKICFGVRISGGIQGQSEYHPPNSDTSQLDSRIYQAYIVVDIIKFDLTPNKYVVNSFQKTF
jgi:hypothetical protein